MSNKLTVNELKNAMPKQMRAKVTQDLVDKFNNCVTDPAFRNEYRNNLISYTSVMMDGKFKMQSYLDAVRYVTHKLLGCTNIDAFRKTFPERYEYFVKNGTEAKTIAHYASSYNKNKLVNLIAEQTMIPVHVLNADLYQKAINTQADLMINANSEKVRTDAANSLLVHLKPPETKKIELDVGVKADKTIDDLRAAVVELSEQQKTMLTSGAMDAKEVAHSKLKVIDGEVLED